MDKDFTLKLLQHADLLTYKPSKQEAKAVGYIGQIITLMRQQMGLSRSGFGIKLGIDSARVTIIEQGKGDIKTALWMLGMVCEYVLTSWRPDHPNGHKPITDPIR